MAYIKFREGMLFERVTHTYKVTISEALVCHGHNRTHAATMLGISRRTLLNYIKQFGLSRARVIELAGCILPQPEARRDRRQTA